MAKNILFIILRVSLGLFFIFSAYTKFDPIEYFEFQLVNDHLATWTLTSYLARLLIGAEFFLGLALVANVEWRRSVVKMAFAMVAAFTVYLLVGLITKGNEANCNCFGAFIKVSTKESIVKNLVLLALMGIVWRFDKGYSFRYPRIILTSLFVACTAGMFVANPIDKSYIKLAGNGQKNIPIDIDFLYTDSTLGTPSVDLRKGKHVLSFMSLSCPHCRLAALKMSVLKNQHPNISFFIVLNGDSSDVKPFVEETKITNIEHNMLLGERFVRLSGLNLPAIYLLNNGVVEEKIKYVQLNEDSLVTWVNRP